MPLPWLIGGAAVVLGGAVAAALSDDDSTTFPKIKESNRVGKTSLNEVIGVIISSKRKSLNLKQREFSDLIGLTDSSVSKIEKGHTALNIESLFIILSVLGIALDEFKDLLQLSLYILSYEENIYVYVPNDLKARNVENSKSVIDNNLKEKVKGMSAISNILKIQIPKDDLGVGNQLALNLVKLHDKNTNDFGDSLEVELVKYGSYLNWKNSIQMNNKVIAALEKEIATTEEQITKIDISQVDYIKEMNKKLESLKDQLNYYQAYYIKIKSEMMRFNQELYKEAGLTKEVYITDASEVTWASNFIDIE